MTTTAPPLQSPCGSGVRGVSLRGISQPTAGSMCPSPHAAAVRRAVPLHRPFGPAPLRCRVHTPRRASSFAALRPRRTAFPHGPGTTRKSRKAVSRRAWSASSGASPADHAFTARPVEIFSPKPVNWTGLPGCTVAGGGRRTNILSSFSLISGHERPEGFPVRIDRADPIADCERRRDRCGDDSQYFPQVLRDEFAHAFRRSTFRPRAARLDTTFQMEIAESPDNPKPLAGG